MYRKDRKEEYYTRRAHEEGYPARSVYKLKEIDEKYRLFKKGDRVLDLGCAPGSWLLYISQRIGPKGLVIGIDLEPAKIKLAANSHWLVGDILELAAKEIEGLGKFETLVSDVAPYTTGMRSVDAGRSLELAERSFEIANMVLAPAGNFLCKIFESQDSSEFIKTLETRFEFIKKFRPKAVFKTSPEFYLIAKGFKPEALPK